jgi:hypothetical protein
MGQQAGLPAPRDRALFPHLSEACHCELGVADPWRNVGMAQDARLAKSFDLVTTLQREDGDWVNQHHLDGTHAPYTKWTRSCPYATFHAAAALHASRNPRHRETLPKALRFLVWHLSAKPEADIRRPFYHGHQTLRELLMLSELGICLADRPVRVLLDWLPGMYVPGDGRFRYNGKPIAKHTARTDKVAPRALKYWVHHVIEDDWLTYHALRILARTEAGNRKECSELPHPVTVCPPPPRLAS